MYSLFAQASQLSLSSSQNLRDIDHRVHNIKYVAGWCSTSEELINILTNCLVCRYMYFGLKITPCYDPFQLLDTFMADSEYSFALSLTICEPCLDSQSNTISQPVIHWFCDLDLSNEISVEEAEALFSVKISLFTLPNQYWVLKKHLSTIVEINTMCGFDPTLKGADICKYFDLPCLEVFENPVKYSPNESIFGILCLYTLLKKHTDWKINQTALPAPINEHMDTAHPSPSVTHVQAEKELPPPSHTESIYHCTHCCYYCSSFIGYVFIYQGIEEIDYMLHQHPAKFYTDTPTQIYVSKLVIPLSTSLQMPVHLQEMTYSQ